MSAERVGVQRLERAIFVRTLFGDLEGSIADEIASRMREVHFDQGSIIYRRGEASDYIYFIEDGSIVLESPDEPAWTLGPKDGIGFQDAMQDRPHARDARALTDTRVVVLSVEDWLDIIEDHGVLGRNALRRHAESVRKMIARIGVDGGFPGAAPGPSESGHVPSAGSDRADAVPVRDAGVRPRRDPEHCYARPGRPARVCQER